MTDIDHMSADEIASELDPVLAPPPAVKILGRLEARVVRAIRREGCTAALAARGNAILRRMNREIHAWIATLGPRDLARLEAAAIDHLGADGVAYRLDRPKDRAWLYVNAWAKASGDPTYPGAMDLLVDWAALPARAKDRVYQRCMDRVVARRTI